VAIDRVDHPADVPHVDPEEEVSAEYSINLVQRGQFAVGHGGQQWRVGPSETFVTVPGQVNRYVHQAGDRAPDDVCIAVSLRDAARDEIDSWVARRAQCVSVAPATNRRAYLRERLFDHLTPQPDALALESIAGELAAALLDADHRRLYRPAQLSWYARRIDAARQRLDQDFSADHSLTTLACDAGMSAFHFARVFGELAGVPPHRYLIRRRMAAAAKMLRDGASVTDTCLAVGFQSLSHFVHTFRRTYGVPPSAFIASRGTRSS
jgi:AraC family transcriptional regulator